MANNKRIKIANGYAVVSKRGKIYVDTVSPTRLLAEELMFTDGFGDGYEVRKVSVVVTLPATDRMQRK